MARYAANRAERQPPSTWPAWVLEGSLGGFVPDDPTGTHARSRQRREDAEIRRQWRFQHTDMTYIEFLAAVIVERARRRDGVEG